MGKKLREGFMVGNSYKRGGPSTPSPTWRLGFSSLPQPGPSAAAECKEFLRNTAAEEVSARKLCADLWEVEQFRPPIMRRGLRKLRRGPHRHKVEEEASAVEPPPDGPPHDHQPLSSGTLRRQISAVVGHSLVRRNGHAVQPVSPASYTSSLEVSACNRAFVRNDSSEVKSPSYSLKTSTKLLKVLNRIWSLEEQHAANMSLVKALKMELDRCRMEIKELQQEKHADREGIRGLTGWDGGNKLARKGKEQEQLKAAIRSARKLEEERKLRKQSESLHQKLGREVCEVKHCFAKALRELERERRARVLLENLCDEFAEAVKDYEDDVRQLGGKKSPMVERENTDRLIVHVAEAWLDERFQMKLQEDREDSLGKNSVVDKLGLDIETFLRAKRSRGSRKEKKSHSTNHLNEFERRCSESKLHSLDTKQKGLSRKQGKGSELRERVGSSKLEKVSNLQNPQEGFECNMATSSSQLPAKEIRRDNKLHLLEGVCGRTHGLILDHQSLDGMMRNQSVSSEGDKIHPESSPKEAEHCGPQDIEKSTTTCSKQARNVKEETLKTKLMEARLESRRSRS